MFLSFGAIVNDKGTISKEGVILSQYQDIYT